VHWYRGAIVRAGGAAYGDGPGERSAPQRRQRAALATGALALACLLGAGCGAAKQTAHEPRGTYTMKVVRASFPSKQAIARKTALVLSVRNASAKTVPNVAVTVDSFDYTEHFPELAANKRPIWVLERGPGAIAKPPVESEEVSRPGGGQTAYVNTWALGPLAAGVTRTFRWVVAPVKPGVHTVHYVVAAGLAGNAKARLPSHGAVQGKFTAEVAPAPPARHVNPSTGRVVAHAYPTAAAP
jgi:hypothetical protein